MYLMGKKNKKTEEIIKEEELVFLEDLEAGTGIKLGGLHDYIFSKDRKTLIKWALALEKYQKKESNLRGGLHDLIRLMSDADIAEYILTKVKEFPELDSEEKLNELIQQKHENTGLIGGGIIDYVQAANRTTLINWALALEAYHREVNQLHLVGGLHDMIGVMSKKDIKKYIMTEAHDHSEITNIAILNGLVTKFNINFTPHQTLSLALALEDIPRNILINWALTTERYHRTVYDQKLIMGGLHDYVNVLSTDKIIEYIVKEADEHDDLNTLEKLSQLANEYGIEYVPHTLI